MMPRRLGPEEAWQVQVGQLLDLLGYTWAHFRPARTARGRVVTPVQGPGGAGYPDVTAWRPGRAPGAAGGGGEWAPGRSGRVVFIELKAPGAYANARQLAILEGLAASGAEVYVARPEHLELLRDTLAAAQRPRGPLAGVDALMPWRSPRRRAARAGAATARDRR